MENILKQLKLFVCVIF